MTDIFGTNIESIYLWILIISGCLIVLYLFFGDLLSGVADVLPIFNPVLILAFFTFFAATGFSLESLTALQQTFIIIISSLVGVILAVLLHIFVLVPLSSAEESLVYREESLKGRVGTVIIPIPEDGYGEVLIESNSGRIAKPAGSFKNKAIQEGCKILVIEIEKGVLYVIPYEEALLC